MKIIVSRVSVVEKRYNPDQPRVPAGDPRGGQWAPSGGTGGRSAVQFVTTLGEEYELPEHTTEVSADPKEMLAEYGVDEADLIEAMSLPGLDARVLVSRQAGYGWEDEEKRDRLVIQATYTDQESGAVRGRGKLSLLRNGTAYMDSLSMQEQGHGLGTQAFRQQIDLLERSGYSEVGFFANISIGRYAWAKEGAQYAAGDASNYTGQKFAQWLEMRGVPLEPGWPKVPLEPLGGSTEAYIEWMDEKADAANSFWRPQFAGKGPAAIAGWKHPKGYKVLGSEIVNKDVPKDMELDVGKAYMLDDYGHGSWDAVIKLNPRKKRNG